MAYQSTKEIKKILAERIKTVLPKGYKVTFKTDVNSIHCFFRQVPKADVMDALADEEQEKMILDRLKAGRFHYMTEEDIRLQCMLTREHVAENGLFYPFQLREVNPEDAEAHVLDRLDGLKGRCFPNQETQFIRTLKEVAILMNSENYNRSNPLIDYFDVRYYCDLSFGEYDKPCKLV